MVARMQLEGGCENMENEELKSIAIFKFKKENADVSLDLKSPNFSEFVKILIQKNYVVTKENVDVSCDNKEVDIESLKDIVVDVHKIYGEQLALFYRNIKKEITTFYGDNEVLLSEIENYINMKEAEKIVVESIEGE